MSVSSPKTAMSSLLLCLLLFLSFPIVALLEPKWWRLYWYEGGKQPSQLFYSMVPKPVDRHFLYDSSYFKVVGQAVRLAVLECQNRFHGHHYWHCPVVGTDPTQPLFGKLTATDTREAAFLHALTTASVVREVAKACAAGELKDCSCDPETRGPVHFRAHFRWRPCGVDGGSDNLNFAVKFTKRFIDRLQSCGHQSHRISTTRLHNIAAGRTQVRTRMSCRCATPFGSCSAKQCENRVNGLEEIGAELFKSFQRAKQIGRSNRADDKLNGAGQGGGGGGGQATRSGHCRRHSHDRRLRRRAHHNRLELWYLDETPTHCDLPHQHQWPASTCSDPVHCSHVCCNGYRTRRRLKWQSCTPCRIIRDCCHVTCDQCLNRVLDYICI